MGRPNSLVIANHPKVKYVDKVKHSKIIKTIFSGISNTFNFNCNVVFYIAALIFTEIA